RTCLPLNALAKSDGATNPAATESATQAPEGIKNHAGIGFASDFPGAPRNSAPYSRTNANIESADTTAAIERTSAAPAAHETGSNAIPAVSVCINTHSP